MEFFPNFEIPSFCEYYKFLLVDEVVFCVHPIKNHVGKCSLIGVVANSYEFQYLKSLSLELPECYKLPDCFSEVRLTSLTNNIPNGSSVEIFGELNLINNITKEETFTPADLITELRNLQLRTESSLSLPIREPTGLAGKDLHPTVKTLLQSKLDKMKKEYVPVIRVHNYNLVNQAKELIHCNLNLRNI